MFAEIPSYLPWALTVAALSLVFVQGLVLGRQVRSLRATLKERCDTLGRELHATTSGSMGVGQRLVSCERQLHELRTTLDCDGGATWGDSTFECVCVYKFGKILGASLFSQSKNQPELPRAAHAAACSGLPSHRDSSERCSAMAAGVGSK